MAHTCRGTINLENAFIHTEDSCNFVVSNGGTQRFHLKATSEVERQKWVTALELAKARAIRIMESDEDKEDIVSPADKNELMNMVRTLQAKMEDLNTCNDLITKVDSRNRGMESACSNVVSYDLHRAFMLMTCGRRHLFRPVSRVRAVTRRASIH
jgi:hypothetical protein